MPLRLAITPGEPAGVGPELLIQLAQAGNEHQLVAIADPELLLGRSQALGLDLKLQDFDPKQAPQATPEDTLFVAPVSLAQPASPGKLNPANASYVLQTLETATSGCLDNTFDALITGPVQKSVINEAGIDFTGHTEWLQQRCGVEQVVMMLCTDELRVALATTHLPLKEVAAAITTERLQRVLDILLRDLKTYFTPQTTPKVLVAGLNPHAGEGGHMGREEIEIMIPVLDSYNQQGEQLQGPLPADTLFTPKHLDSCDAVLAMYHDQGLPVLKYQGFGRAVNITLGLPIIRTSVDHGTALDLAGTGKADTGSLETALKYAVKMARNAAKQA